MLPKRSYPVTGWHEEPINKKHDQEVFDCGEAPLNDFLRRYARRSHELGGAKTFLAIDDADDKTILGFYSLSPASVDYARTPEIIRRGLARHDVPGFRFARLAMHRRVQRQGIGGQLLLAAGRRCLAASAEVGGVAVARCRCWTRRYPCCCRSQQSRRRSRKQENIDLNQVAKRAQFFADSYARCSLTPASIFSATSWELITGCTSNSTRSFQFAIHWSSSVRSSVSMS